MLTSLHGNLGNYTLRSDSVPSMYKLIRESARKVPNPNPDEVSECRTTVYDTWLKTSPDLNNATQPR